MPKYLYSSVIGTFVFDERFHILFEQPFDDHHKLLNIPILRDGGWLDAEKAMLKQYGHDLVVVGSKKDKAGAKFSIDEPVLAGIAAALRPRLFEIAHANLIISKRLVRDSFSTDDLILQCARSIRDQDKIINMSVKRLREWYELYNPEPSRLITDNEQFVGAILAKDKQTLLAEFKIDAQTTMGANLPNQDVDMILRVAKEAQGLIELRDAQKIYIAHVMEMNYRNISAVATPLVGAELLSAAGGLRRMALMPSSTIQLLGAEKALFKHIKDKRVKPPKHGVLVNHPLMAKVEARSRGKLARVLADKISLAARLDFFKGEFKGDSLLNEVEGLMRL